MPAHGDHEAPVTQRMHTLGWQGALMSTEERGSAPTPLTTSFETQAATTSVSSGEGRAPHIALPPLTGLFQSRW